MATILLTGATGYVGGRLLPELLGRGHDVRCLVRAPEKAALDPRAAVIKGDVLQADGLDAAFDGVGVAYYLVHSMGGGGSDFADADRRAAANFGDAAAAAGVERVVYLGGLEGGDEASASEHLRSRHEVAEVLRERVPSLVYVRAAMILGGGSASFQMLRHLVQRLPAMITPRWVDTRSQPVAIDDVVRVLAGLADRDDAPAEVQLGGADVLTYREMMGRFAKVDGRRPPLIVPVPVLTPRLSSYWVSLFTPIDRGLVGPLVEGLSVETVVSEPPPAGINDDPLGFEAAVRAALDASTSR